jgi:hypothetical protein
MHASDELIAVAGCQPLDPVVINLQLDDLKVFAHARSQMTEELVQPEPSLAADALARTKGAG